MTMVRAVAAAGILVTGLLGAGLVPAQGQAQAPASAQAGTPPCTNAMVEASYRGGGAAASHAYGRIVLTNTSSRTCSLRGFGGLSYVGGGDGTQVGAAADRVSGSTVRTVVLRPGARARSRIVETSAGPYPRQDCVPAKVDGFRVYVPDATASQFVTHPTTGCTVTAVHLLRHQAFTGPRGPA